MRFLPRLLATCLLQLCLACTCSLAQDWLVDPTPYRAKAQVLADGREILLTNGLIQRKIALAPNAATIEFRNLLTGDSILRGVKPEATIELDGQSYRVGGLIGQPNYAFLDPQWIPTLRNDPQAFQFQGYQIRESLQERMAWKQTRHHAPNVSWPPKGIELILSFAMPSSRWTQANSTSQDRTLLWEDPFDYLHPDWRKLVAQATDQAQQTRETSMQTKGGLLINGSPGKAFLIERTLPENAGCIEVVIDPMSDRDTSWGPGLALVWPDRNIEVNLRPGDRGEHGHFELRNRGSEQLAKVQEFAANDGGIERTFRYSLRVRWQDGKILWDVASITRNDPSKSGPYHKLFELPFDGKPPVALRIGKSDRNGNATDSTQETKTSQQESKTTMCSFGDLKVYSQWAPEESDPTNEKRIGIDVHYELYDGLPAYCKWITVHNTTQHSMKIDRYCSDILAAVEHTSEVDALSVGLTPPNLHIETEMAFGGMTSQGANRRSYRWVADPDYHTQVNYEKKTPCLLEVGPDLGPAATIAPGQYFSSYRAWVLVQDSFDRERSGLAVRKLLRCIAPWSTENPLMMHLIASDDAAVMQAIDQCHEVGFEMLILSFGSGFNLESQSPATMEKAQRFAQAAKSKNIEIGSYSLLASRSVGAKDDVIMPEGQKPVFGNSPCLESHWGQDYFARLYEFHRRSGFTLLEHDGSYPGDPCGSQQHPGHIGYEDSRWNQWSRISEFYRWCRAEGLFLNVPDHYFLVGSNKTGMGYREVNWSLPREQQTIHTRQNIYDGTWQKTPSMGWMFVPLTQYHGGGAAATIEPLDQNIDHYRNMIQSNLALGVQACYRGPRLYDTERVKQMVASEVAWYKRYRDILESDIIHGRRADAAQLDWCLHANPQLDTPGLLVVFNPTSKPLSETIKVPMHYTGLRDKAMVYDSRHEGQGAPARQTINIDAQEKLQLQVTVPAYALRAYALETPSP